MEDVKSDAILNKQNSLNNNTDLDGKYGYDSALSYAGGYSLAFYGYYCIYCVFTCCWCSCMSTDCICVTLAFIFNIIGACSSIPLALPYLKDQIIGPDHQIISCGHIEVLDSWLNDWCTLNKLRIILSWLLILAKGLFLTWLEKRKEKSMQQNEIVTYNKSIKEDTTDDIKIITVE
ncbi:18207_t:CDS:2 [Dentiscutata erythropus]|uniref:18207_t:CDS:1 n=1 Tax=Dentiscutata erythropus TaxID=1348616 RepID=A0A9N8ZS42_9GLOM|nr:18207_t:CDS:2 [Dentiscutata erythropus]